MAIHNWKDVRGKKLSPSDHVKLKSRIAEQRYEMDLRALREALGKSQAEVAELAAVAQSEISRAEAHTDHLVSSLRRVVEALGGELRIAAVFPDREVELTSV